MFSNLNSNKSKHSTTSIASDASRASRFLSQPTVDSKDKLLQTQSNVANLESGGNVKRKMEKKFPRYSVPEKCRPLWDYRKGQFVAAGQEPTSPPEMKSRSFADGPQTTTKKTEITDIDSLLSEMDITTSKKDR